MKALTSFIFAASLSSLTWAEPVSIDGTPYRLVDSARYCFLPFVPVYRAHLYRTEASDERLQVCLRLDYERNLSAQTLSEATRKTFVERHGEAVATDYADLLDEVDAAYQDVSEASTYQYCLNGEQGVLSYNSNELLRFSETDFAVRFMQIWLKNPSDDKPNWNFRDCS